MPSYFFELSELTEKLEDVGDILKWKLCGSVTGTTIINLPESFNELLIIAQSKDKRYTYDFSVPYDFLTEDYAYIRNGMGNSEASKKDLVTIKISKSNISLENFFMGGTNITTTAIINVYYR